MRLLLTNPLICQIFGNITCVFDVLHKLNKLVNGVSSFHLDMAPSFTSVLQNVYLGNLQEINQPSCIVTLFTRSISVLQSHIVLLYHIPQLIYCSTLEDGGGAICAWWEGSCSVRLGCGTMVWRQSPSSTGRLSARKWGTWRKLTAMSAG